MNNEYAPFATIEGKQAFLAASVEESHYIKIDPPLPCTTQDCLNRATVASVAYDPVGQCWQIIATCKGCAQALVGMYNIKFDS